MLRHAGPQEHLHDNTPLQAHPSRPIKPLPTTSQPILPDLKKASDRHDPRPCAVYRRHN